ncbi:MAG: hypothetical protein AB7P02_03125 [Alphaproteobacteria bacterium]
MEKTVPLRPPAEVLATAQAGASWSTALSFTRAFVRKMVTERWRVERVRLELDSEGRGEGLYRLVGGGWTFHFLALSDVFPQDQKVDRSFGINWDVSAVLCQGDWTPEREAMLRRETPLQYSGRYDDGTLCFSRGNRSERIFDYVVDSLAEGRQPDPTLLAGVGYIFRTTAFAGNGLFGMRAFAGLEPGHPLGRSYYIQIAIAFLLRGFVFDLVDHLAVARGGAAAVPLDRALKRYLGIGNSAGLGLIPFAVQHPQVVGRWCLAREKALAAAKSRAIASGSQAHARFSALRARAVRYFTEDPRDGNGIFAPYALIADELAAIETDLAVLGSRGDAVWDDLCRRIAPHVHPETLEAVHTILLDLYPDVVAAVEGEVNAVEHFDVRPELPLAALGRWLDEGYGWLLPTDERFEDATAFFWYYPVEAPDEPRRALRRRVPAMEFESRMDGPFMLHRLKARLDELPGDMTTGELLARHPELRSIVMRIQSLRDHPYAELRENYVDRAFTPFNATRFVLAFYGMEKLDPRPPRSVKGALLQGAPLAADIAQGIDGEWPFPVLPRLDHVQAAGDIGGRPLRSVETTELTPKHIQQITPSAVPPPPRAASVALFPVEYRKLVTKALAGRGVPLGLADEIVSMAEFADALGGGGVAALVDWLEGLPAASPSTPALPLPSPMTPSAGSRITQADGIAVIDAAGEAAVLHAPGALDLATAAALAAAGGVGRARIVRTGAPFLLAHTAHRAAERGLTAIVDRTDAAGLRHTLVAAPTAGPWLAAYGPDAPLPQAIAQLLPPGTGDAATVTILCLRPEQAPPVPTAATLWDAASLARALRRQSEVGTSVTQAEFDRLTLLAKVTLMPEHAETKILP